MATPLPRRHGHALVLVPRMLACDADRQFPDGTICLKLFINYGVCVVEEPEFTKSDSIEKKKVA